MNDQKTYTEQERAEILQEIKDRGNAAQVGRLRGIPYFTLMSWQKAARKRAYRQRVGNGSVDKLEIENQILRELLKDMMKKDL